MPETLTPAAPAAPVSAPAPSSTPAAAPATSAPVAPATTAAPSSPSGELTTREKLMDGWSKAKTAVPLEEPTQAAPAVAEESPATGTPAEEGAEEESPEAAAESAAAAAETTAEENLAEATTESPAPGEMFELDDTTPLGPQEFAKALESSPEAKKFFDDNPEIKGPVFAALRRDAETRELREYVPDVATAKVMSQAAATWHRNDNLFLQATTKEGASEFLNEWTKQAMITGDDGKPALDAQGKYQFHPALLNTFNHIFDNRMSVLRDRAKGMPEEQRERLEAALDIIAEVNSPSQPGLDDVPEELKPFAEKLSQKEKALTAKEKADQQADQQRRAAKHTESIERAEKKAEDSVIAQLEPRFKAAGLTDFERKAAIQTIGRLLGEKLASIDFYQSTLDSILMREPGETREKEHLSHIIRYSNQVLGPIVTQVIREAKGGALNRQKSRQEIRTTQEKASATDPKTRSTAPVQTAPVTDPQQLITHIRKEWEAAHPGEEMPRSHLISEQMKRSGAFAKRG